MPDVSFCLLYSVVTQEIVQGVFVREIVPPEPMPRSDLNEAFLCFIEILLPVNKPMLLKESVVAGEGVITVLLSKAGRFFIVFPSTTTVVLPCQLEDGDTVTISPRVIASERAKSSIARMFSLWLETRLLAIVVVREGYAMAARIPKTARVTINSIRVKPLLFLARIVCISIYN